MNPLKQYPSHKKILEKIFASFDKNKKYQILDAGSGRTSLYFLTKYFPQSFVTAIIYPGDNRKKNGIKRDIRADNYELIETDLQEYKPNKEFDIALAHLLLGEATKFNDNTFKGVLQALLNIKTKYLVIVDIKNDPDVNFDLVLNEIKENGEIENRVEVDKYIGYLIKT